MKSRIVWCFGKLITLICFFFAGLFMTSLVEMNLLPGKYLLAVGGVLLLVIVLICVLIWSGKHPALFVFGTLLALLYCAVLFIGFRYCRATTNTVKQITTVTTESADVGIYVRKENETAFSESAASYTYGILAEQDRSNTNLALEQYAEKFGFSLITQEFDGLTVMVDALLNDEIDAVIMNASYMELLEELEGYEDISDRIVRTDATTVTTQIITTVPAAEDADGSDTASAETVDYSDSIAPFTVFISGVDTRGELTSKTRSDVNILATVNPETHQILLVSTPRDYFVPLSVSNGQKDKLTHAGIYGVQCCMDTLSMLYDVDVNYYVRMNFVGFKNIIDALGGVTVNSEVSFSVDGYQYVKGDNDLNGTQALAFARERHAFSSGDRQRGKNQMAVIKAVINKATSPAILTSYTDVLAAAGNSFEMNISYDMISELVQDQLANGGGWNVVTYSVNGSDGYDIPYSMSAYAYVMIPDETTVDTAKELMAAVLNGETIEQP